MTLSPGTILKDRYRIVSVLGQGGMGAVYRAEDDNLGIDVAVKENLFLSDEYTRQFQREANILAGLRHPNLPRVIDYFSVIGQGQYLIMDYVDGEDMRQRIERLGVMPEREVVLIGAYICDALTYLHSRTPPIVHRDIKPGNIKITPEGEVVLVDFGLAKVMHADQVTTTGARAMTPGYSPPEQYGTARTDPRTDIYSLSATLYAAITGIIPEDGLARATGKAELTPPRNLTPGLDRRLANALEKALEVDPDDRYQSADEFKRALVLPFNLNQLTQPRVLVTPPPPDIAEGAAVYNDDGGEVSQNKRFKMKSAPISSRRRKYSNWGWFVAGFTALAFVLVLIGIELGLMQAPLAMLGENTPTLDAGTSDTTPIPTLDEGAVQPVESTVPVVEEPTATATLPIMQPTQTKTPLPAELGGGGDLIVFASSRTGSTQLWTMHPDGSELTQLTDMPGGACQPDWSPDGAMIAFISPCSDKEMTDYPEARIYTMLADGEQITIMPNSEDTGNFDPAWSPDGTKIAFTSLRTGTPHIFVYDFVDQSLHELSDTRYADVQPSWSPDGSRLAFVRQQPFFHVWIMSNMGETLMQMSSSGNVIDLWPYWSPDGQTLIFSRSQISPTIPYLMKIRYEHANSGLEVRLPGLDKPDPGPIAEASLSADGKWIVFESWPDGRNHDIYLMDINGENRTRLTTDPAEDFGPDWRPAIP